jgi:hypothetical protein
MRFAIDEINCYKTALFINGWAEREVDNTELKITLETQQENVLTPASLINIRRQDLHDAFGSGAAEWGFAAVFLFQDAASAYEGVQSRLSLKAGKLQGEVQRPGATLASRLVSGKNLANEEFIRRVNAAPRGRVLEIGSRARSGISRRGLFSKHDYTGLDIMAGANVDIVGDAHSLSKLYFGQFDFVVSTSVFEHLIMPWKVAIEAAKVMKTGGLIQTNTHQCWTVHDSPWDFWRFSDTAWAGIFNKFTGFRIIKTCMFEPVHVVAALECGNKSLHFGTQSAYAGSACLAEKIGEPSVEWGAHASELTKDFYPA